MGDSIGEEVLQRQQHRGGVKLGLTQRELLPLDVSRQITPTNAPRHKTHPCPRLGMRVQSKQERAPLFRDGQERKLFSLRAVKGTVISIGRLVPGSDSLTSPPHRCR